MSAPSAIVVGVSFSPSTIAPGETSTMTITLQNLNSGVTITAVAFTDTYPTGLHTATPANRTSDAGGAFTSSSSACALFNGTIGISSTVTLTIDVTSSVVGSYVNAFGVTGTGALSGSGSGTLTVAATSIIQGTVKSVTSLTAGTIVDTDGNTLSYSDSTLVTRGVELELGERVIGKYNSTIVTNVVSLVDVNATILANLNSANDLTAALIKQRLQTYNCCAQKQGQISVDKAKKGDEAKCKKLLTDAILMTNIIDSICGIIPEGEIISGDQAAYEIIVTSTFGSKVVTLAIGSAAYSFTSATGNATDFATDIAYNINLLYPQSYSYYAIASGANVVIVGSDFDDDNGTAVSGTTTNGGMSFYSPNELFAGTEAVIQGENNITNGDIQVILDKLNKLCKMKCKEIFPS